MKRSKLSLNLTKSDILGTPLADKSGMILFDAPQIQSTFTNLSPEDFTYVLTRGDYPDMERCQIHQSTTRQQEALSRTGNQNFGSNVGNQNKKYSNHADWTRIMEKVSGALIEANKVDDDLETTLKLKGHENHKMILDLPERQWYKDLFEISHDLYKAKAVENFSLMRFDRKRIQIEEHFKFLTNASVNFIFNTPRRTDHYTMPNKRVFKSRPKIYESSNASKEYNINNYEMLTPEQVTQISQKTGFSKYQNSNKIPDDSKASNQNSVGSNLSTPIKRNLSQQSVFGGKGGNGGPGGRNVFSCEELLDTTEKYAYGDFLTALPYKTSELWGKGFVWKGVYFRLLNGEETKLAQKMLKKLKFLAVEYYGIETTKKLGLEGGKGRDQGVLAQFQLPLINLIKTASYSVIVSPIIWSLLDNEADAACMNEFLLRNEIISTYDSKLTPGGPKSKLQAGNDRKSTFQHFQKTKFLQH